MKILGYVASFNDAEIIDQCIEALRGQTYPVNEILIVDNGSTDGTADRTFPDDVTLIRHPTNLGTNGAAITAFQYALAKAYDWVWVFDADTVAHEDALEKLMQLYAGLSPDAQTSVFFLASTPVDARSGLVHRGAVFTKRGCEYVKPDDDEVPYRCDASMWTGCLYRMGAVRDVGLPPADYFLDLGDIEYGYRGKLCGYYGMMHQGSILDHNVHALPSVQTYRVGPLSFKMFQSPPIRRYYVFRNTIYFWLYEYRDGHFFRIFLPEFFRLAKTFVKILILPGHSFAELSACMRGMWDGFRKNLDHRY